MSPPAVGRRAAGPGAGFRPVGDVRRLAELSGQDPWVRRGLPGPVHAWHDPATGALAVVRTRRPYGTSLFLLPGAATLTPQLVEAAVALAGPHRPGSLTAPASASAAVAAAGVTAGEGTGWEWRWTASAPPAVPAEAQVEPLDGADPAVVAALADLLAEHSPRHSATPGSADVAGWVGVRRGGRLVACAARLEPVPGVPLLASVAVHPDARRQGLAAALTAAVTRRALAAGAPAVTVDLYSDNDAARRVYRRLGFRLAHAFVSWPVAAPI